MSQKDKLKAYIVRGIGRFLEILCQSPKSIRFLLGQKLISCSRVTVDMPYLVQVFLAWQQSGNWRGKKVEREREGNGYARSFSKLLENICPGQVKTKTRNWNWNGAFTFTFGYESGSEVSLPACVYVCVCVCISKVLGKWKWKRNENP